MRSHRIDSFRLFLLMFFAAITACPVQAAGAPGEARPGIREQDVEEPQIALPQVIPGNPFRNVALSNRKESSDKLVQLCQEAVDTTARRMLSTELHTPWQMMHALLGLRQDFHLLHEGQPVSGLDWIAEGQTFKNEYWFEKTKHGGRAHPYSVPYAFEGHANQCLAVLSMCGVELDREFGTATGPIRMRDMIRHAQMTVNTKDEPTWTLWALSRYLAPHARWRNQDGEAWSIEKLVEIQCNKPIVRGAPCGGTHALFALAHARNVYQRQGKPLRGVWLQAEYKIRQFTNTARSQQHSNGLLSSNYFRGRSHNPDFNKRMASAGHLLEFLMIALPQEELNTRWVRRAVEATARELLNNRKAYVKCSPLYHSVDALNIYLDRVNPRVTPQQTAEADPGTKTARLPLRKGLKSLRPVPALSISESRDVSKRQNRIDRRAASHHEIERDRGGWAATPKERQQSSDSQGEVQEKQNESKEEERRDESPPQPAEAAAAEDVNDEKSGEVESRTQTLIIRDDSRPSDSDSWQPPSPPANELVIVEADDASASQDEGDQTTDAVLVTDVGPQSDRVDESDTETSDDSAVATGIPVTTVSKTRTIEITPAVSPTPDITGLEHLALGSLAEFLNAELDIDPWIAAFSSPEREIVAAQDQIVAALGLRKGMSVADVGAGTGLFLPQLSSAVGETGRVFAIDVSPRFVEYLETLVETSELDNVDVVRNHSRSLMLMRHKVDRILVCDSYHHFDEPADMLTAMFETLQNHGEVVLVSPRLGSDKDSPEALQSVRSDQSTFRSEFADAGFEFVEEVEVPELRYNYVLRFRKPGPQ